MGLDMSEVDRLADDLALAPVKATAGSALGVYETARSVARDASILAPVDTGFLSEHFSVVADGLHAEVEATARYSGYVEFGTSDTAPQPFMRPAAARNIGKLADAVGDAGEDIL